LSQVVYATIDPRSPRYQSWLEVLGTDCLELESGEPTLGTVGDGPERWFYRVRVVSLNSYQLGRLAVVLAAGWGLSPDEVRADVRGEHGLPILAEDVHLGTDRHTGRARFAVEAGRSQP